MAKKRPARKKRSTRKKPVDLDKFLKEAEAAEADKPECRCKTCQHPEAADLIVRFFERKREGATRISFRFFYDGCLSKLPGYEVAYNTALTHVRRHLKIDPQTGAQR